MHCFAWSNESNSKKN